jgi:hypothetical protein
MQWLTRLGLQLGYDNVICGKWYGAGVQLDEYIEGDISGGRRGSERYGMLYVEIRSRN